MFFHRKSGPVLCTHDPESPYYQPLNPCIAGTRSQRWISIEHRTTWPSQSRLNSTELDIHGKCQSKCNWRKITNRTTDKQYGEDMNISKLFLCLVVRGAFRRLCREYCKLGLNGAKLLVFAVSSYIF